MSIITAISSKPAGAVSKAAGAATLVSVLYDSHYNGKEKAVSLDRIKSSDRFYNQYQQYLTSPKNSATLSKMKKFWYNIQQDYSYFHLWTKLKGYVSGFGETFAKELPLVVLSTVALKSNTIGKAAGVLLAANGVKTFLCDVAGVGSKQEKSNLE